MKNRVKYNFDRIILTQGTILTMLRLPGCWCRQRPQGGAVTEGALTIKLLSPAALLIKQCAAPEHKLFSHRDRTVTIQAGPIKTFCSCNKNGWQ